MLLAVSDGGWRCVSRKHACGIRPRVPEFQCLRSFSGHGFCYSKVVNWVVCRDVKSGLMASKWLRKLPVMMFRNTVSTGYTRSDCTGPDDLTLLVDGPPREGTGLVAGERVGREVPKLVWIVHMDVVAETEAHINEVQGQTVQHGGGHLWTVERSCSQAAGRHRGWVPGFGRCR